MTITSAMKSLINQIQRDNEFKKICFFIKGIRTVKKEDEYIVNPYHLLDKIGTKFLFLYPLSDDPLPQIGNYIKTVYKAAKKLNVEINEIKQFCLSKDYDAGEIHIELSKAKIIGDIVDKSVLKDNNEKLLQLFISELIIMDICDPMRIGDIEEIEELDTKADKYGLTDVSNANFEYLGYTLDENFYLYNVFINLFSRNETEQLPVIIALMNGLVQKGCKLFMRTDLTTSIDERYKPSSDFACFEQWRGKPISFSALSDRAFKCQDPSITFDKNTLDKLVMKSLQQNNNGEIFYDISVETLRNPENICKEEGRIATCFFHGCYYPDRKSFDHIDYSINEYDRELYNKKYIDNYNETGVPIDVHGDKHYKVWCIKGDDISLESWAKIVDTTIYKIYRPLFEEIIIS